MFFSFSKEIKLFISAAALSAGIGLASSAQAQSNGYFRPPKEIADIVENATSRNVLFSNKGLYMAILERPTYLSIEELSRPYLGLAGLRVDPQNYGNFKSAYYETLKIKSTETSEEFQFKGIPKGAVISDVAFSPDESKLAFALKTASGIQLWLGDIYSQQAKRLSSFFLNDTYGRLFEWSPSGETILAKFVPDNRPKIAPDDQVPDGPVVMENMGESARVRTYQDLLRGPEDVTRFEHYLSAQLKMVYLDGQAVNFNRVSIYKSFDFSPDGMMVMVKTIEKPYSFTVPLSLFPFQTLVLDKYGKVVKKLAETPVADKLPDGFDAVLTGPREHQWRLDKPQTFIWVEAQDKGNPAIRQALRDIIYMQDLQSNKTTTLAECYLRFHHIDWGDDQIAIVTERWFKTRSERRVFIKPGNPSYRVNLWDRYYEDGYSDPGYFVKTTNEFNQKVLLLEYNPIRRITDPNNVNIFSISEGASPAGNRPFLLQFNVKTKLTDTLFHSQAPFYERPVYFNNSGKVITSRESAIESPNYFSVDLGSNRAQQITYFPNPHPEFFSIMKKQVDYNRKPDNLHLSGTLYLPKNYTISQGRLPVLMWAYPREYKTSSAAGQVKGSPYQFPKISWSSPLFWVTQGYAVLDNADMPIVGESNEQPNDTFIQQLSANAKAAVDKLVAMGIADPKRIAIGGHSYGAFMTANLLAHTQLFAAGIARSGAYNRTLTPFGFQSEERNYWENPTLYHQMSPFSYANQIKTPLLLIHGMNDDNSGTFPIQSERFYNALKGYGATTRLVMLPSEAHSYKAKESVMHMLWEMDTWLKKYVKNGNSVAQVSGSNKSTN